MKHQLTSCQSWLSWLSELVSQSLTFIWSKFLQQQKTKIKICLLTLHSRPTAGLELGKKKKRKLHASVHVHHNCFEWDSHSWSVGNELLHCTQLKSLPPSAGSQQKTHPQAAFDIHNHCSDLSAHVSYKNFGVNSCILMWSTPTRQRTSRGGSECRVPETRLRCSGTRSQNLLTRYPKLASYCVLSTHSPGGGLWWICKRPCK